MSEVKEFKLSMELNHEVHSMDLADHVKPLGDEMYMIFGVYEYNRRTGAYRHINTTKGKQYKSPSFYHFVKMITRRNTSKDIPSQFLNKFK